MKFHLENGNNKTVANAFFEFQMNKLSLCSFLWHFQTFEHWFMTCVSKALSDHNTCVPYFLDIVSEEPIE